MEAVLIISGLEEDGDWLGEAELTINIDNGIGDKITVSESPPSLVTSDVRNSRNKPILSWTLHLFLKVSISLVVMTSFYCLSSVLEKKNMVGVAVMVVLLLLAIVTGGVLYYRRRHNQIEREPLTNGPSMSSLQKK